jgi:F0F1-type ATP synthase membrane subunit a
MKKDRNHKPDTDGNSYPDTSLSMVNAIPYYKGNLWQKILAHDGKNEGRDIFNLNSTILVFIFNANTIETTPWDNIVKHYMVLKRYQTTKNDMEKSNWTITYP